MLSELGGNLSYGETLETHRRRKIPAVTVKVKRIAARKRGRIDTERLTDGGETAMAPAVHAGQQWVEK